MGKRTLGSVQREYIQLREILGEVLCLASPTSPTKRTYRAIIEVSSLNFLLKAEEEQAALIERYRGLLKSLTFPLQIIIRNERLDLRPYLARLHEHIPPREEAGQWPELAEELEQMLQKIGSQRTLIARHCYIVIPAPESFGIARGWRKRRRARQEEVMERAIQELRVRVERIRSQLSTLGLRTHCLTGEHLARFYESCVQPERALQRPLSQAMLAAVGHLPMVRGLEDGATSESPAPEPADPSEASGKRSNHRSSSPAPALPVPDVLRLADVLAPGSIEEERDALRIDDEWCRGIVVTAFPREVSSHGWLAPLLMHDEILDMVFHLHPQESAQMMRQLKRRRSTYNSTRQFLHSKGRQNDPDLEVAQNDVTTLMSRLASGNERVFEMSLLLLVRAPSREALEERSDRVMALLQSVFLDSVAHVATFEQGLAFRSFLPEARDLLRQTIPLDGASVASTFPFLSNALMMPAGTFLGITATGEPVLLDPWDPSLENPHIFLGGVTGSGKSYVGKSSIERSLLVNGKEGERYYAIDPDAEYEPTASAMAGSVIRIAPGSEQHLNPFDLRPPGSDLATYLEETAKGGDRLAEKVQDLLSLLNVMLADPGQELGMRERSLLDAALYETYRRIGISRDPLTHFHEPPLMRDLAEVLKSGICGKDEYDLGLRLARYVDGSLASLFSHQTNVPLDSHLLVWDIREMRGELRPVGMFLIADCIWTQAFYQSHIRRALYIDEAASLLESPEGGRFLKSLSQRARKRYLRLVVMTQNPELFVEDEFGSVVAANAAIKMLKLQDRTSVQSVAQRFGLTPGEQQRLLTFGVEEALLLAGDRRVLLTIRANEKEHALITTNPVELALRRERQRGEGKARANATVPGGRDVLQ